MLTEADMIRIMTNQYCLTESLADVHIDSDERRIYHDDRYFEVQEHEATFYDVAAGQGAVL